MPRKAAALRRKFEKDHSGELYVYGRVVPYVFRTSNVEVDENKRLQEVGTWS